MCENCINSLVVADLPYECSWFMGARLGSVLHEYPCIPKYILMPSVTDVNRSSMYCHLQAKPSQTSSSLMEHSGRLECYKLPMCSAASPSKCDHCLAVATCHE